MKMRALVVDDSRMMRKMVMDALLKTGMAEFEFTEAGDGQEALDRFSPNAFDVVFADWNMPRLSGVDFCKKVRGIPAADKIPIIMVTSEKTVGKMETAMDKAGADGYVCKPFTPDDLSRQVNRALAARAKRQEAAAEAKGGGGGFFSKLMKSIE